jgi:uncharacterized protein (DUF2235 family)
MESLAKNIVICSDGTGNSTIKGRGTNVFKLFEAVDVNGHRSDAGLARQLAFYDDGVGTENLKWLRIFAGATGYGLSRNVKQLYREVCRVYEPGDAIYLFGFSRGAFTVRTLSGLIGDCGLIDPNQFETEDDFRESVRLAYKAYRRKYRAWLTRLVARRGMTTAEFREKFARKDQEERPVRLLGVWDTVDAVGLPFRLADVWNRVVWQYKFETSTLCAVVNKGCHALALDDERGAFGPVLWDERDPATKARVEQVWFAGAHSNVGGGYPQQGMSLVALDWMLGHAEREGLRFVKTAREMYQTQHSFSDKLYDPRSGLGMFYRWKPRDVQKLCAARGIDSPKIHVSAVERVVQAPDGYAPGNIPATVQLVATEEDPQVRLDVLADAIAASYGSRTAMPLLRHKKVWIRVGAVSYGTLIGGIAFAIAHMLAVHFTPMPQSLSAFIDRTSALLSRFPLTLLQALWNDTTALSSLAIGLSLGFALSSVSAHRLRRYYSGFWHQHRPRLRAALRRTPPPAAPIDNVDMEAGRPWEETERHLDAGAAL